MIESRTGGETEEEMIRFNVPPQVGKELAMNRGKAAVIDLLEARIKHLKANLRNTAAASLYSDGTGSGGKEFGGLKLLIADAPSGAGVVGGIDQAANAFWRNKVSASAVFNQNW